MFENNLHRRELLPMSNSCFTVFLLTSLFSLTLQSGAAQIKTAKEREREEFIQEKLAKMPKPFGIRLGSIYKTAELPVSIDAGLLLYKVDPPSPSPLFQKFAIQVSSKSGRIKTVSAHHYSADPQELSGKARDALALMTQAYGPPETSDSGEVTYYWKTPSFWIILSYDPRESVSILFKGEPRYDTWIDAKPPEN